MMIYNTSNININNALYAYMTNNCFIWILVYIINNNMRILINDIMQIINILLIRINIYLYNIS